jgi:hypothetical protein
MFQNISSADRDPGAPLIAVISARALPTMEQRRMKLCSRIRGRERWHVKLLENHPRLAAAVELVLQTETGILEARVNPVTGRVLVRYDPATLTHPIETILRRALEASPLSLEEFRLLHPKPERAASHTHLLALEALFHVVLMGGFCPLGLVSAAMLFLVRRKSHSHRPISAPLGYSESAVTN